MTQDDMHQQTSDRFASLERKFDEAQREQREMAIAVAKIEGGVQAQNALLEAVTGRAREEITALFAGRREHEGKIQAIQVDYVPRAQFERHQDDIDQRFTLVMGKLDDVTAKMWKASGAIAFISALAGWLVSYFGGHR